jgi:cytochrome c5
MNKSVLILLILLLASCSDHDTLVQNAVADTASPSGRLTGPLPDEQTPPSAGGPAAARASVKPPVQSAPPAYDLELGEAVFTHTCIACHGKGAYHAPVLGNASDWEPRLKQDTSTLVGHAINGHRGMPPKGGFFLLSDEEVAAAVAYVVERSREIVAAMKGEERSQKCDPINNLDKCSKAELEEMFTLQMLWLLGGNGGN